MTYKSSPHLLFVNPWIYDFAAYDVWSTPLGLLKLAALCREAGMGVSYLDCLDRFHPLAPAPATRPDGRGPYRKTVVPPPTGLADIPRRYSRYGMAVDWARKSLRAMPVPDMILVSSMMTYWYPGVQFTIRQLRRIFPDTPILLGGIYASLCSSHARKTSGADEVICGPGEPHLDRLMRDYLGYTPDWPRSPEQTRDHPIAALDLASRPTHAPVQTSTGCPFRCAYCASHQIHPHHIQRDPMQVAAEIGTWHRCLQISNFAIYDDALLYRAETHFEPLLDQIIKDDLNIRFHTPNALHMRWLTPAIADRMYRAGFQTIRLGLESTAFGDHRQHDQKVTYAEFEQTIAYLHEAGFNRDQVGAYLLAGLPNQPIEPLLEAIEQVCRLGVRPIPAYYTPIPGTDLWPRAVAASRYDLAGDPIFTNNALLPCRSEPFSWDYLNRIKTHIRENLARYL